MGDDTVYHDFYDIFDLQFKFFLHWQRGEKPEIFLFQSRCPFFAHLLWLLVFK